MIFLEYPKYNNEKYNIKTNVKVNISNKGDIKNSTKGEKYEHKN